MFEKTRLRYVFAAALLASVVSAQADVFNMPAGDTSLQFVTVGNPGNPPDTTVMTNDYTTGYGSVPYVYQMGKYDVTLGQYTTFLNAVAVTDTYGLYNSYMSTEYATQGIQRTGSSGSYLYSVTGSNPQAANCPVFDITWGDAARFCNWLQNGHGTATSVAGAYALTESGAYTLNGDTTNLLTETRNAGAAYFIPTENEWYKAAYYNPSSGTYTTYATQSNLAPANSLVLTSNDANYFNGGYTDSTNYLTPVGYFSSSPSAYGTFDQSGDVWQWNEAVIGSSRGLRGGGWYDDSSILANSYRGGDPPAYLHYGIGFRVASVPEFGSLSLSTNGVTLRAMRNSGTTTPVTLSETTGVCAAGFSSTLGGAASVSPANGVVAASGAQGLNLGWSDYTTTGPLMGTVTLNNMYNSSDPFNSSGNVINMTGAVVDNRVVTSSTPTFAVHVGSPVSQPITLATTGDDDYFTRVSVGNAGPDANGISVTGGSNPIFNAATVTDVRTLSGVFSSVGTFTGSITLPTTGEGLPGEAPINVPVNYTAQVFSGKAHWNLAVGASWGSNGNWQDTQAGGPNAGAPGISGFAGDTATFGNSIGSSAAVVTLDGENPTLSSVTFNNTIGGSFTFAQGTGGTLTLSNTPGDAAITVSIGSHQITAPVILGTTTDVTVTNLTDMLTISGAVGGSGGLNKYGLGTLILGGSNSYTGTSTIASGTLQCDGPLSASAGQVTIESLATLVANASIARSIQGVASTSRIVANTANVSLGDPTSYTGFNHAGTLTVGSNTVTLNSAGFANLGVLTTLGGGTLIAPNGVSIGVGCNLVGSGVVNGKIAAGYGSTINATGNLILGDSTSPVGFVSNGELYTNANTVTLNSFNAANNQNAVVLGSLTQLDGGSLIALNGILLANGNNLVTTDAGGSVSGGPASRFLNRGNVQGPSSSSNNWLTFNLLFKGSTGQTSGRLAFLDGFATGDCPGVNTQYGCAKLGGSGTEFDIGGTTPGNTDNNYGQLNILTDPSDLNDHGDLILSPGTSFNIVDWNGFVPAPGEEFTVLTWSGARSGTASLAVDPAFASHGVQFVPRWNSNSLVLEAVPEPSPLALLGVGTIGLLGYAWRRRWSTNRAA